MILEAELMMVGPTALDLSFQDEAARPCARVLVIRPWRDSDDAVTLNVAATSLEDFERHLDELEQDIRLLRERARAAFSATRERAERI